MEIAKITTNFLTFQDTYWHSGFLFTSIIFNIAQILSLIFVLLCYFGGINPSSWIASSIVSMTFVFFRSLGLRLTISRRKIVGLSLIFISIAIFLINFVFLFFLG